MSGDFSLNHIKNLCSYIYNGDCKSQFISICERSARGETKAASHLLDTITKTAGTAIIAGIVSSFVGMGVIIVPVSSTLIFANGMYSTDYARQIIDKSTDLLNDITDGVTNVFFAVKAKVLSLNN